MKAYKGFNYDMKCNGFQYEEGQTYECEKAEICECGFHACLRLSDCFRYYSPNTSVYHEVELDGDIDKDPDSTKVCATKITIGRRLDIFEIAHIESEYMKDNPDKFDHKEIRNIYDPEFPYHNIMFNGSDSTAFAGYGGIARTGIDGFSVGDVDSLAIAGVRGTAFANYGTSSAGRDGVSVSIGYANVGDNGIAVAMGYHPSVKGGMGSTLVLIKCNRGKTNVKTIKIDGKTYKPDTWYYLDSYNEIVPDSELNLNKRNMPV